MDVCLAFQERDLCPLDALVATAIYYRHAELTSLVSASCWSPETATHPEAIPGKVHTAISQFPALPAPVLLQDSSVMFKAIWI